METIGNAAFTGGRGGGRCGVDGLGDMVVCVGVDHEWLSCSEAPQTRQTPSADEATCAARPGLCPVLDLEIRNLGVSEKRGTLIK